MKKVLWTAAVAGAVGLAGLLLPGAAWPQDADDDGAATQGCFCDGAGGGGGMGHGRGVHGRGMHGMMDDDGPGGMMGGGAWGGMGGTGLGMGGGMGLGPIWRLDLTDSQRTQLTKIADDFRRQNWDTIGKLLDARSRLRDAQSKETPDPKQVGAAFGEVSKLRGELLQASMQARNQARALLTPAQRQQLDQWRTERHEQRSGRSPGAGPRPGPANPPPQR